jgi:hypothetical protein
MSYLKPLVDKDWFLPSFKPVINMNLIHDFF